MGGTAGYLKFDTTLDTKGFKSGINQITGEAKKGGSTIKSIVGGLGIAKIASVGLNAIKNSIGAAVSRFDTLQNFPKVMQSLGFSAQKSKKSIDKLSSGIEGLPTSLDEIVQNTQLLTSSLGDLEKGTESAIALNDMFLAGGQGAEAASRALNQYNQMLAKGKVDQQSWNTLVEVAPGQLNQVAKSLLGTSANQKQLYKALQDGKISMKDFNNEIIKLDKEGGKGFSSFREQAESATGGIATSFQNIKTAIVKNVANMIGTINETLESLGLGTIQENLNKIKDLVNIAGKKAQEVIPKIIELIYNLREPLVMLAGLIATIKIAKITYGAEQSLVAVIRRLQEARIQAALYNMEVGKTSVAQALFNKDLTGTEKAFAILKQVNLGDKFASLGEKAKSAGGGVLSFLKAHKGLAVGLGVAGVAIGGAIALYKKSGGDAGKMAETISSKVKDIIEIVKNIASKIPEIIKEIMPKIINFITTSVPQILSTIGNTISSIVSSIIAFLPKIIPAITTFLSQTLPHLIIQGAELLSNLILSFGEKVPELINNIIPKITEFLANQFPELINKFATMLSDLAQKISQNLPKIIEKINTVLPQLVSSFAEMLPKFISTVISSLMKMLQPIMKGIITLINSIISMLPKILPILINGLITLIQGLINALITFIPMIIKGIITVIMVIISMLGTILPPLISALIQAAIMIIQALVQALPQIIMALVQAIPTVISALIEGLLKCIPQLIMGAIQLVLGLVKAIPQIIMALVKQMPFIIKTLVGALLQVAYMFIKVGWQMLKELWNGIKQKIPETKEKIKTFAKSLPGKIKEGIGKIGEIGKNLVRGLWYGIKDTTSWIIEKIKGFGSDVLNAIKKIFKVKSPSRETMAIGQFLDEGLILGIEKSKKAVMRTVDAFGNDILSKMQNAVALETGNINASASLKANASYNNTIVVNSNIQADVMMDRTKVGQAVTPVVSQTLKKAGVR